MEILVGTASWTEQTLIKCGRFYPKEAKTPRGTQALWPIQQFPIGLTKKRVRGC